MYTGFDILLIPFVDKKSQYISGQNTIGQVGFIELTDEDILGSSGHCFPEVNITKVENKADRNIEYVHKHCFGYCLGYKTSTEDIDT